MHTSTLKRQNGFTIVELLIVIIVIAILAAITVVGYGAIQRNARISAVKTDLKNNVTQLSKSPLGTNQTIQFQVARQTMAKGSRQALATPFNMPISLRKTFTV